LIETKNGPIDQTTGTGRLFRHLCPTAPFIPVSPYMKMDLQKVGRGCGDWIELAEDRDR
jgi:hypothetical protein